MLAGNNISEGGSDLVAYADNLCRLRLDAYAAAPHDVEEHSNIEASVLAGGYAYRQVAELVQNAADAIIDGGPTRDARIEVVLDAAGLWSANTGASVDAGGVRALLNAHSSSKRSGQIGRFGLGFKSLLKLGGRIDVLSRTTCLRFDPESCRSRIRAALGLPSHIPAPGLRLAEACSWPEALRMTPAAARFGWASTIVFAEVTANAVSDAVADEIRRFPPEFLLFLPCDVELLLIAPGFERHLQRASQDDGTVLIRDLKASGDPGTRWRVFETKVQVRDEAAIADATSVHAREAVPLIWATPVASGPQAAGRFYAFFPTATETRLPGILNAPWKLNSDRTAVIPGAWNTALMQAAADLIVKHMPELSGDSDPGAVLDAFPRELANQSEPAAPLVEALWSRLLHAAVIPDCDGNLKEGVQLFRPPVDDAKLASAWARLATQEWCSRLIHPTCSSTRERTGRLNQLASRLLPIADNLAYATLPRLRKPDTVQWLLAAAGEDPEGCIEALHLTDRFADVSPGYIWSGLRDQLRMILCADGDLATAPEVAFEEVLLAPLKIIHPEVAADSAARKILEYRFHIEEKTGPDLDRLLDSKLEVSEKAGDYTGVWEFLRGLSMSRAAELAAGTALMVKTRTGWADPSECLFAGGMIQDEDLEAASPDGRTHLESLLVDEHFHRGDRLLLERLGVRSEPAPEWNGEDFHHFADSSPATVWKFHYVRNWRDKYWTALNRKPDATLLEPEPGTKMPSCWALLLSAGEDLKARVTAHLLNALSQARPEQAQPVMFRHRTRTSQYDRIAYPHPIWSLLLKHGLIRTQWGGRLTGAAILSKNGAELARMLPSLSPLLPAFDALRATGGTWKGTLSGEELWVPWLEAAAEERLTADTLSGLWNMAGGAGVVPAVVCSPAGPVPLGSIWVSSSAQLTRTAGRAGFDCVTLDDDVAQRWISRGARSLAQELRIAWSSADGGGAMRLSDLEPVFQDVLKPDVIAPVVFVGGLRLTIATLSLPIDWIIESGRLVIDAEVFRGLSWAERIQLLLRAVVECGWAQKDVTADQLLRSGVAARRRAAGEEPDLAARLLCAVGGATPLLQLFEPEIRSHLGEDPAQLARVAITLFGPGLLGQPPVREALQQNGLEPPARWGSDEAAEFVAAIGFPSDYASSPSRRREPELAVSGPSALKPLHSYQENVVAALDHLLAMSGPRRRAVISLPTGAGKTRVAAQTAVTRILAPDSPRRLVVWIAQTDELCEQAVQCFRQLWANLGTENETLRIIRFWGGHPTPQASDPGDPTVIVASIQTLTQRLGSNALGWASTPGLIVIDECHHAITKSYTGVLRWMDSGIEEGGREPPVIGLSATPFRGLNEDESLQLARRFDGRLIPADQAGLFENLQERGVLARFRYSRLDMKEEFGLTPAEEEHVRTFLRMPESALERLGQNAERNRRIIEALVSSEEQSALVFATSVSHAQRLAAELNVRGIPAAAVSGETDQSSRRWFIRSFQRGDIRVLCNHSVLTTGFDAPATDLIVIARPVFSPPQYMQMVGRGLRGPLNGGTPFCRILTVQDNLAQYSGRLAHHYFEQYYVERTHN